MEKVAPWRSTMTVYGGPDNASADDEEFPPCLFSSFSVSPITFFTPCCVFSTFPLSSTSLLQPFSCFPSLPSTTASPSLTCAFYNLCSPQSQLHAPSASENKILLFFMFCVFPQFFILFSTTMHMQVGQTSTRTHTDTPKKQNCGQILFMTRKGNIEIVLE